MAKKLYATYSYWDAHGIHRWAIPCDSEDELMKTLMELNSYAAVSNVRANRSGRLPKGTLIKTLE